MFIIKTMLGMIDKLKVISLYQQGYSVLKISSSLLLSRNSVYKIIREYDSVLQTGDPELLSDYLHDEPKFNAGERKCRRLTVEIKDAIDSYLQENERMRASGIQKYLKKNADIYELLMERGFDISYATVSRYISGKTRLDKKTSKEAFMRICYEPGISCEFDWGEVKLRIGKHSHLTRFFMAVFTFSHSNGRYAYLFRHQNELAFMESHRNFFRDVMGVPKTMVYDNMKVAISKCREHGKEPTEALLALCNFYKFSYRFCSIRAGWEKGHVEKSVYYVRRKAFCSKTDFDSIEDAQRHLSEVCSRLNGEVGSPLTTDKKSRLAADLAALTPQLYEIGCFDMDDYMVDKWSTVNVGGSHYSVPDTLVGEIVQVRKYSERIAVYSKGQRVAQHERSYDKSTWSVKLEHYVRTLLRKPGALTTSEAFRQLPPKMIRLFEHQFSDRPKEFVQLVAYASEHGFNVNDIVKAYSSLTEKGLKRVSADQLKAMMHGQSYVPVENSHEGSASDIEQALAIERMSSSTLNSLSSLFEAGGGTPS